MYRTQHTGFKTQLLAVLFLLFNCVCTAAPALKLSAENNKDAISMALAQTNPQETEEENSPAAFSYINQSSYHAPRKHCNENADQDLVCNSIPSFLTIDQPKVFMAVTGALPVPGYYAFLYRFNLF